MQKQFSRTLPVHIETEIFIAGGGPAGVAAALAASRLGKKCILQKPAVCLAAQEPRGLCQPSARLMTVLT